MNISYIYKRVRKIKIRVFLKTGQSLNSEILITSVSSLDTWQGSSFQPLRCLDPEISQNGGCSEKKQQHFENKLSKLPTPNKLRSNISRTHPLLLRKRDSHEGFHNQHWLFGSNIHAIKD